MAMSREGIEDRLNRYKSEMKSSRNLATFWLGVSMVWGWLLAEDVTNRGAGTGSIVVDSILTGGYLLGGVNSVMKASMASGNAAALEGALAAHDLATGYVPEEAEATLAQTPLFDLDSSELA